jgi:hypothetical protein
MVHFDGIGSTFVHKYALANVVNRSNQFFKADRPTFLRMKVTTFKYYALDLL